MPANFGIVRYYKEEEHDKICKQHKDYLFKRTKGTVRGRGIQFPESNEELTAYLKTSELVTVDSVEHMSSTNLKWNIAKSESRRESLRTLIKVGACYLKVRA